MSTSSPAPVKTPSIPGRCANLILPARNYLDLILESETPRGLSDP